MATTPDFPEFSLDLREQVARIDRMQVEIGKWKLDMVKTQADVEKIGVDINKAVAETSKIERDKRLAPWSVFAAGLGAGAALIAAGAALTKLIAG